LPDIENRFAKKYGDKIAVVAIDANGDALDGVQKFLANLHPTFLIGLEDPATKSYAALTQSFKGSNPFPVDVVVDKDGKIVYVAREYDPNGIGAAIDAALAR
jgi:redoxin